MKNKNKKLTKKNPAIVTALQEEGLGATVRWNAGLIPRAGRLRVEEFVTKSQFCCSLAGDCITPSNGYGFSTYDHDADGSAFSCAKTLWVSESLLAIDLKKHKDKLSM